MEKISLFLKQFGVIILIAMVGVGVLVYGLWDVLAGEGATVEIFKAGSQSSEHSLSQGSELGSGEQVTVDIAGAVEKPGVYKLPSGSRIGDALVMAGGLSASADREWVAKTINLAESVKDGGKIYIPTIRSSELRSGTAENSSGKVNINTASISELDGLVGIGEVRAQTIIANRPYGSVEELVSKAKIPQSVYDKIKDQLTIY